MIKEFLNPKTEEYLKFKKEVLSGHFPWFWTDDSVQDENDNSHENPIPLLTHTIIKRPLDPPDFTVYPKQNSGYANVVNVILQQIFLYNKINLDCVFRVGINLTMPLVGSNCTLPHVDHDFPHKNLLVYFNESDGDTVCGDDRFTPKEDAIIVFEGEHYHYLPSKLRRLVLVCTFM
jgi:hypothetical protein